MKTIDNFKIISSLDNILKEISIWKARLSEKEKKASDLLIQTQNLKITLNLFLGEYNSKIGVLYVNLDKIRLKIKEYKNRIILAKDKKLSPDDLNNIEAEIKEKYFQERSKLDNLESDTFDSSEEYDGFFYLAINPLEIWPGAYYNFKRSRISSRYGDKCCQV